MLESDVHPITPKPKANKAEPVVPKQAEAVEEEDYADEFEN